MKLFELDWDAVLAALPAWGRLPLAARRALLDRFRPGGVVAVHLLGPEAPALFDSGLVVPAGNSGKQLTMAVPFRPFLRAVRAMDRLPLLEKASRERLLDYLKEHFSATECANLAGARWSYGDWRGTVAERISAVEWVEGFRQTPDPAAWESERAGSSGSRCFTSPQTFVATRALIDRLLLHPAPLELREVPRLLSDLHPLAAGMALDAAIRYLLLFPTLRRADLEPVLGLWPPVRERLSRPAVEPPVPVEPEETIAVGFALEDLTSALAACAAQPLRLRVNDRRLFTKARGEIEAMLAPLPRWAEEALGAALEARVDWAFSALRRLGDVGVESVDGDPCYVATARGAKWLALPVKERLQRLLDRLRAAGARRSGRGSPYDPPEGGLSFLPHSHEYVSSPDLDEPAEVAAAFADLPADAFIDIGAFVRHRAERRNPLVELVRQGRRLDLYYGYSTRPVTAERLETLWRDRLLAFLVRRLVFLGGARLGRRGRELCFALTGAGRYLLGLAADFEWGDEPGAEIVVQPNFEVVFLSPAPITEAVLARFAERKGTGVGTLFRITRKSILAAAAAGLSAGQVLATLSQAAPRGVPANVEREIAGWFDRCRRITVKPAVLIDCPDRETAGRVLAAASAKVVPLTDTVLRLLDPGQKPALLRKLREQGVFVGE